MSVLRAKAYHRDLCDTIVVVPASFSKLPISKSDPKLSKFDSKAQSNSGSKDTKGKFMLVNSDGYSEKDVTELVQLVRNTPRDSIFDLFTTTQLLHKYPEFNLNVCDHASVALWKDIIKQASPKKMKNAMRYNENLLNTYHSQAVEGLLASCNLMRHVISVIKAVGNKKVILAVMGKLQGQTYVTGGGSSPATRRMIVLYEREGECGCYVVYCG